MIDENPDVLVEKSTEHKVVVLVISSTIFVVFTLLALLV
jgi:hypothetical protein